VKFSVLQTNTWTGTAVRTVVRGVIWIGIHLATHYNADQRTTVAATGCIFRAYSAAKYTCSLSSVLKKTDSTEGAYGAPLVGTGGAYKQGQ